MKIAVDLTPIFDHLTGIERYNINIVRELVLNHPEDSFILVFKKEVHTEFKEIVKSENVTYKILEPCNKFIFLQKRLLKAMNGTDADYYLFLSFTSPYFFKKKKAISAIHDLTCWDCPDSIPSKMKHYYRLTYKRSIKNDWKIITVSKFSQKRICEKYGLTKDQVPVIYDGLADLFKAESQDDAGALSAKYNIPERYILSLSTIEPRKNLQLLISAYQDLIGSGYDMPELVLAGRKGWKLEEILANLNKEAADKIHFTGFVDDADLPALYKNSEMFVFPSKYEGFGLPVIEAMSQRSLVLSSDAASLPEIVGNNGVLFESGNKEDLKKKLIYCLEMNTEEKKDMTDKARIAALGFDWKTEAEKLHCIMAED